MNDLTTVTIPDSVTSIGDGAFSTNDISSLTLGTGLTSIAIGAFGSNDLTTVTIPDSVTSIGDRAFEDNKLTSVTIPDSVTSIGDDAFGAQDTNSLTSVTFEGDYHASFAVNAFEDNSSLTLIEACDKASGWEDKSFVKTTEEDGTTNTIPVTLTPTPAKPLPLCPSGYCGLLPADVMPRGQPSPTTTSALLLRTGSTRATPRNMATLPCGAPGTSPICLMRSTGWSRQKRKILTPTSVAGTQWRHQYEQHVSQCCCV